METYSIYVQQTYRESKTFLNIHCTVVQVSHIYEKT